MTQIISTEMVQATNVRLVLFCCLLASFAIQGNKELFTVWFKQQLLLYSVYNYFSAKNYIFKISASGVFYRKIHCLTREFHVKFHAKNRYRTHRFAIRAISVFRVKFNVEFTSQAVNFS